MLIIGHRGAAGHAPENTLLSIRRALALGANGIEVDVHLVEGRLVVIHDRTVNRTTNGRGRLGKFGFERLRELDAGHGERVPTLEEVADALPAGTFLNVEMKGAGTAGPTVALLADRIANGGWREENVMVSSFDSAELRVAAGSGIPVGALFKRPPRDFLSIARKVGAVAVNPAKRYARAPFVLAAHEGGMRVYPYTANLPKDLQRLYAIGVDGVFTDFPDRAVAIVEASRAERSA